MHFWLSCACSYITAHHKKMGPQHRLKIYVGFNSSLIIKCLESLAGDFFAARFVEYHFDKIIFFITKGGKPPEVTHGLSWKGFALSHLDLCISHYENKVRRIEHLRQITNQLLDAITNITKVIKSPNHIFQLLIHQPR